MYVQVAGLQCNNAVNCSTVTLIWTDVNSVTVIAGSQENFPVVSDSTMTVLLTDLIVVQHSC